MCDHVDLMHLKAGQCRERAKLIRYTAQAVRSAFLRDDLLDIAREYDERAVALERDNRAQLNPRIRTR